jgi:hypothetical protein
MLLKDCIVELRQKGASLGLIRELLATVDVVVSTATIARFLAEMTDSSTSPGQPQRFNRRGDCVEKATRRRTASVSTNLASSTASPPAMQTQVNEPPAQRPRTREPRGADPRNL